MPVQHGRAGKVPKRACLAGLREAQFGKAYLLEAGREDPGAECGRNQLRTKTDAECRPLFRKARRDEGPLGSEERIGFVFIDANRTTQNDQQIRRDRIAMTEVRLTDIAVADIIARRLQRFVEGAEIFEVDMAQNEGGFRHDNLIG